MSNGEQAAPQQETLEQQPIAGGEQGSYYGALGNVGLGDKFAEFNDVEAMDRRMPERMRTFCNEWVVAAHQFDNMESPAGALLCGRVLRMFLIFFIVMSTTGLIVGFVLKGKIESPMATEQVQSMVAPSLVLCPSPWGTYFKDFNVAKVEEGLTPGESFHKIDFNLTSFNSSLANDSSAAVTGCHNVELGVRLQPHGPVAAYTSFDTVRVTFDAASEDGNYMFGFTNGDGPMPQRWATALLGQRETGEIGYDQTNVGASDVSEGDPRSTLNFNSMGAHPSASGSTELDFYYGYFMIRILQAQARGITVFAIVAFMLLVAASVNNCGLFDLFFVEYVPDDEPPPELVPNMVCQVVCGRCFSSCRRRKEPQEETEETAEEAPEPSIPSTPPPEPAIPLARESPRGVAKLNKP